MLIAATVLFVLHALVAMVDGAYFHLYKYKLHTRPESVVEHLTHTLRAATMAIAAFLFFVVNVGGLLLWAGIGLIALDLVVETWDVLIERRSRAGLGGLSSVEYLSHAHAILLYSASYACVLAAKPPGAFAGAAPLVLAPYPELVTWVGWAVGVGAAVSTIQHVVYLHPSYRRSPQ
jgi:hypothetical protein